MMIPIAEMVVAAVVTAGSGAVAATSGSGIARAPEETAPAFADAWNRHDMDAFAALFDEHADFVNVIGLHWRGREQIRRAHAELHRTRMKDSHLAIQSHSVRMLRPDVALVHATWDLAGDTGIDGRPSPPRHGVLSFVVILEGGRWLIAASQNTDIVPLPNVPPAR